MQPFQSFMEEHRTYVYRFLLAAVGPADADDCFQETFLSALRAYPKLEHERNLRGWILAIASRKAIDAARGRGRRAMPVAAVPEGTHHSEGGQPFDARDPLWRAVRALPQRQRVALVHRVIMDRPYEELASAMGTTVEAARANVHQALKHLREGWSQGEDD